MDAVQKRRDRILGAASALFLKHGYDDCTLDAIAAKARVGKQAIYEFFDDKSHLYSEVIAEEIRSNRIGEIGVDKPAPETLAEIFEKMYRWAAQPKTFLLMRSNILTYERFPALAAELHESLRRGSSEIAAYLNLLASEQRIRPLRMDSFDLATRMSGTVTGGTRHLLGAPWPTAADYARDARSITDLLLHGSRGEPLDPQSARDQDRVLPEPPLPFQPPRDMRLKQEKFDALRSSALAVILQKGFSSTSIDEMIQPAGIGRATVYRLFESKVGFFRFLIEDELARLEQERIAPPEAPSHRAALQQLAADVLRRHLEPRSIRMHRLLIRELKTLPDLGPRFYRSQILRLQPALEQVYRDFLGTQPSDFALSAFHSLATYGVRYLVSATDLDPEMITAQSSAVARIFTPLD